MSLFQHTHHTSIYICTLNTKIFTLQDISHDFKQMMFMRNPILQHASLKTTEHNKIRDLKRHSNGRQRYSLILRFRENKI